MAEQRKYNRVPVQFNITCVQADGISFEGSVRDVSLGGMFIECAAPPVFATQLTLVVVGVAARELRLPAIVRWSEAHGFGVQFGLLGAYATHALVDLMKKTSS